MPLVALKTNLSVSRGRTWNTATRHNDGSCVWTVRDWLDDNNQDDDDYDDDDDDNDDDDDDDDGEFIERFQRLKAIYNVIKEREKKNICNA